MTDEEMAEEYANKTIGDFLPTDEDKESQWWSCYNDFLAGLKAGRPQWHDLQKDPTDLPKDMENVIINAFDYGINTCYVAHRLNGKWKSNCSSETFVRVIAWCEIPTFDKE